MKKIVLTAFLLILLVIVSNMAFTNSGGAPIQRTNAPGESNCTVGCHTGTLQTSGALFNAIQLTSTVALNAFQPSTTYPMTLTFTNASSVRYGFSVVALPTGASAASASIGTFSTSDPGVNINSFGSRSYAGHSSAGTSVTGGTKSWTFDWTTPALFNGGVVFYVIINSSNNNSGSNGDVIIARQFSATVLPVEWLSVMAKRNDNNVVVNWVTANEENNERFEIERSIDAQEWELAGIVKGKGTTSVASHYSYKDYNADARYYRVKQIDFDGKFDYSPIMSLNDAERPLEVKYDSDQQKVYLVNANSQEAFVIYSLQGLPVLNGELSSSIDVSSLTKGVYLLQTSTNQTTKLLIN